jgi:hypothetical protein
LGEILTAQKYFGIGLITLTAILISYKKTEKEKALSSALKYMIPFTAILSIYGNINKYLLSYIDYWSLYFWAAIGSAISVLIMFAFKKPRKEFVEIFPSLGKKTFFTSFICEGVYVLGIIFSLMAMSMGPISVISAFSGLQNIFVFGYMIVISLFVPSILKEDLNRNVILQKIVAIIIMFIGTWLIAM